MDGLSGARRAVKTSTNCTITGAKAETQYGAKAKKGEQKRMLKKRAALMVNHPMRRPKAGLHRQVRKYFHHLQPPAFPALARIASSALAQKLLVPGRSTPSCSYPSQARGRAIPVFLGCNETTIVVSRKPYLFLLWRCYIQPARSFCFNEPSLTGFARSSSESGLPTASPCPRPPLSRMCLCAQCQV